MVKKQMTIFDAIEARELRRNTDPSPSHEAAEAIAGDGSAAIWRKLILELLSARPGVTARELGEKDPAVYDAAHKRLPELERLGLVERVGTRKCKVTNKTATAWQVRRS